MATAVSYVQPGCLDSARTRRLDAPLLAEPTASPHPAEHPGRAVQNGLSHLPVVDSEGRVVGAVTKAALFWCLAEYADAVRPQ